MSALRKFKIFVSFFPYGGNGAAPSEHPAIRNWFAVTLRDLHTKYADQVADVVWRDFADTPITMTRNAAVIEARKYGADILVMIDSDNIPDLYLTPEYRAMFPDDAATSRPFMQVVLEEMEQRFSEGPHVVMAPYCGPPPHAPVYIFGWEEGPEDATPDAPMKLKKIDRREAALLRGVGHCAAGPTGCIAFDMRIFTICEPDLDANKGKGWFYYEYKDGRHGEKASTEDVTCTRDMSLIVQKKLGYNPLLVAWDCWAGHVKPVIIGKPHRRTLEQIEYRYRQVALDNISDGESIDAGSHLLGSESGQVAAEPPKPKKAAAKKAKRR